MRSISKNKKFIALKSKLNKFDGKFYNVSQHNGWYEIDIKSSSLFESGNATLSKNAISEWLMLAAKLKGASG